MGEDLQKELLMKVAWVRRMESRGVKNYPKRFQSAEGYVSFNIDCILIAY